DFAHRDAIMAVAAREKAVIGCRYGCRPGRARLGPRARRAQGADGPIPPSGATDVVVRDRLGLELVGELLLGGDEGLEVLELRRLADQMPRDDQTLDLI